MSKEQEITDWKNRDMFASLVEDNIDSILRETDGKFSLAIASPTLTMWVNKLDDLLSSFEKMYRPLAVLLTYHEGKNEPLDDRETVFDEFIESIPRELFPDATQIVENNKETDSNNDGSVPESIASFIDSIEFDDPPDSLNDNWFTNYYQPILFYLETYSTECTGISLSQIKTRYKQTNDPDMKKEIENFLIVYFSYRSKLEKLLNPEVMDEKYAPVFALLYIFLPDENLDDPLPEMS